MPNTEIQKDADAVCQNYSTLVKTTAC